MVCELSRVACEFSRVACELSRVACKLALSGLRVLTSIQIINSRGYHEYLQAYCEPLATGIKLLRDLYCICFDLHEFCTPNDVVRVLYGNFWWGWLELCRPLAGNR